MQNAIKEAQEVLAIYNQLQDEKRGGYNYSHENWHAVNVKRYDDYIDIKDLLNSPLKYQKHFYEPNQEKKIAKYREDLATYFDDNYINRLYEQWLVDQQEFIDEELADASGLNLDYIKQQSNGYIYFLGRSGGWACFQDTAERMAEDLQELIDAENQDEDDLQDIIAMSNDLQAAINEINGLKTYIKDYNNSLDFTAELFYRINEQVEAIEDEKNTLKNDQEQFKRDIAAMNKNLAERVEIFEADKELKQSLTRLTKSIEAILKKA